MTQTRATDGSRTGFLFDGWRPRVVATLGYLLTIAGLIAVAVTGTDSHISVGIRHSSTQAVSSPAGPVALDLATDRP